LRLAAEHGDRLAAVLAFSPASGDSMDGCKAERFAGDVTIPALALRPASELERPASRQSFEALSTAGVRTHVSDPGTHGSSMLLPARIEGEGAQQSAAETWRLVAAFLEEHAGGGPAPAE